MVLTQRNTSVRWKNGCMVSIPLWFLRNGQSLSSWGLCRFLFPYHYGSYATSIKKDYVQGVESGFPYHYGSYATIDDFRQVSLRLRVSIPLWFLRNRKKMIVSILLLSFHTTMVLTQLYLGCPGRTLYQQFPYHYGSYATIWIPSLTTDTCVCFHTTMVLTQRLVRWVYEDVGSSRFHTTMVLTQRRQSQKAAWLLCSFHTTMVLTQPLLLQRYYTGFGEAESTKWKDLVSNIEFAFQRFA